MIFTYSKFAFFVNIIILSTSYFVPTFSPKYNISVPNTLLGHDQCSFFSIYNSHLYRMGQSNIVASWDLSSLNYLEQKKFETSDWSPNISAISIGRTYNQITITNTGSIVFNIINPITLIQTSILNWTLNSYTLQKVQSTQTQYLALVSNSTANIFVTARKNLSITAMVNLNFTGKMNSTLSQDQSTFLIWSLNSGLVKLFKKIGSLWTYTNSYAPLNNSSDMNNIALSSNGTLAIFEYDSVNMLTVINLTQFTIISQLSFSNSVINQVIFIDQTCQLIALTINYTIFQVYDINTLTLQNTQILNIISNYSAVSYSSGQLFICVTGYIQVYSTQCADLSYRDSSTNECKECILQINCNGCDRVNGSCNSCSQNYTLSANLTCELENLNNSSNTSNFSNSSNTNETKKQFYQYQTIFQAEATTVAIILSGFKIISPILTISFAGFQFLPLVLLFINFVNYWNLTCLYSMLNLNIPNYLNIANKIIFDATQHSVFSIINLTFNYPILDERNIPEQFSFDYKITIEFFYMYTQNFIMLLVSLSFVFILISIRRKFIPKKFFLCKYIKYNKIQVFVGQFIQFLPLSLASYKYILNMINFSHFYQKINLFLHLLTLIIFFLIPILYIEVTKISYEQKAKQFNQKYIPSILKVKQQFKNISKNQHRNALMFIKCISIGLLIATQYYKLFFIVNFIILVYDIKIAYQTVQKKYINTISSTFLLIHHICYFVFYLFENNQLVCHINGMICLLILFIGGIFQIISQLISVLKQVFLIIRDYLKEKQAQKIQNSIKQDQLIQPKKRQIIKSLFFHNKISNSESLQQKKTKQSNQNQKNYSIKSKRLSRFSNNRKIRYSIIHKNGLQKKQKNKLKFTVMVGNLQINYDRDGNKMDQFKNIQQQFDQEIRPSPKNEKKSQYIKKDKNQIYLHEKFKNKIHPQQKFQIQRQQKPKLSLQYQQVKKKKVQFYFAQKNILVFIIFYLRFQRKRRKNNKNEKKKQKQKSYEQRELILIYLSFQMNFQVKLAIFLYLLYILFLQFEENKFFTTQILQLNIYNLLNFPNLLNRRQINTSHFFIILRFKEEYIVSITQR